MNVNSTTAADQASTGADARVATPANSSSLGQDAFLTLLVAQLQHQDPTKPMDDQAFLTQLATFSSLEKLTQIADATSSMSDVLQGLMTPADNSGGDS